MDETLRKLVLEIMAGHNVLTLATLRPDGWPQATTVTYANDGLTLYVATGADAQKVRNIRYSDRVSLTIDHDSRDWSRIQGLSMAAHAEVLADKADIHRAVTLLARKFPQMTELGDPEQEAGWAFLRITPEVMSVLDYTKGFGHTTLVQAGD